jgi:hypothetical protein
MAKNGFSKQFTTPACEFVSSTLIGRDRQGTRVSREQDVHVETTVPQLPKPVTSGARSGARLWVGVNYFPMERQINMATAIETLAGGD